MKIAEAIDSGKFKVGTKVKTNGFGDSTRQSILEGEIIKIEDSDIYVAGNNKEYNGSFPPGMGIIKYPYCVCIWRSNNMAFIELAKLNWKEKLK